MMKTEILAVIVISVNSLPCRHSVSCSGCHVAEWRHIVVSCSERHVTSRRHLVVVLATFVALQSTIYVEPKKAFEKNSVSLLEIKVLTFRVFQIERL